MMSSFHLLMVLLISQTGSLPSTSWPRTTLPQTTWPRTTWPTTVYYDQYCDLFMPCKNQGICINKPSYQGFYECVCKNGFTGKNCDEITTQQIKTTRPHMVADEYCDLFRPCENGATCINGNYSDPNNLFFCVCAQGFSGKRCEIKNKLLK